ncbi:MAG: GspH/FimT family pseudopilin [Gammaproteobacteria bacterium]|nr:GspH/FimT family pseudopilin [Gammaproteobacteria bacterium]MCW8957429.1 GspH/FimT family pseudopilin [Gammaproteobacteria bacterium]MCW8973764.1 GspH/FimT family pseudopilin [Gammaproteobacteria bacterium]MCW8993037.1 GspH/FimT family pseudopilin [Gammaproteobacteria bacterium]
MRQSRGFSLVEMLVVMAILAIVLSVAVPAMSEYLDRRKIINAAEAIYGELQLARAETISRSEEVHVRFAVDATDSSIWSIGVSTTAGCDPTITDVTDASACVLVVDDGDGNIHGTDPDGDGTPVTDNDDRVLHVLQSTDFPGVRIEGVTFGGNQSSFDPRRGTADSSGSVTLEFTRGGNQGVYEMRVILGMIGRVRICTPNNGNAVAGYTTC